MARRRANGEGSISRRKDGRWDVAAYSLTTAGTRKRIRRTARTRLEADEKLTELKQQIREGVPLPDRTWRVGDYLDYWLESVIRPNRRPATHSQYEVIVRKYLKPGLGGHLLTRLSVPVVQQFLNHQQEIGESVRQAQLMRGTLSSALTQARREELITRNVAQLVKLPTYDRIERVPWSAEEAAGFLNGARGDPLYTAFVLLVLYGLRRGEVLGLRWQDIDHDDGVIHIRQQLQRVHSTLLQGPVKTRAGQRGLPLMALARTALTERRMAQDVARQASGSHWQGSPIGEGLVFTTRSGLPIEPRNLARSFQNICARAGVRQIRLHDIRHTTATLLKRLNIPARDTQLILGHSRVSTTLELYQHADMQDRTVAIEQIERLLTQSFVGSDGSRRSRHDSAGSRQMWPSEHDSEDSKSLNNTGGIGGARTPDLANVKHVWPSEQQRWEKIREQHRRGTCQALLGVVAVNCGRQSQVPPLHAQARRVTPTAAYGVHLARCAPSLRILRSRDGA